MTDSPSASGKLARWAHRAGLVKLAGHPPPIGRDDALARLQITEVFSRWGMAYDEGRNDVIGSLFTEDATLRLFDGRNAAAGEVKGRDAIVARVRGITGQQGDQRRHAVTNVLVDRLEAASASALAYGIVVLRDEMAVQSTMIYKGEFERRSGGPWRLSDFTICVDGYRGEMPQGH